MTKTKPAQVAHKPLSESIPLNHDKEITISVADSAASKKWEEETLLWSELLKRLSTTVYTKTKGANGCYVGGILLGARKKQNVAGRSLITLDFDKGQSNPFDLYEILYNWAGCIHTTHSHTAKQPKYRVVIPLNREATTEEYEAVARYIANTIDADGNGIDTTTFQPERLFYYPTTQINGTFDFKYQDGDFLDVDYVLSLYNDWSDWHSWPYVDHRNIKQGLAKKQQDPTEKEGLIGAWCSVYDVPGVIDKYLTDIYEPTANSDRYTYKNGSTPGGLVLYENGAFAFSHHCTDPVSGKLCNSFDLVRVHKFGVLDAGNTDQSSSMNAMFELAKSDKDVVLKNVLSEFDDDYNPDIDPDDPGGNAEPKDDTWKTKLDIDKKGNILSTLNNIELFLQNDRGLKGRFALDAFAQKFVIKKDLPWRRVSETGTAFKDTDYTHVRLRLERNGLSVGKANIVDMLDKHMTQNAFHPVRDYLNGLPIWDGVPRLDKLLIDYFGVVDKPYTREVTRKTFVAAIKRILEPGCKFDNVLVLAGVEGAAKSSFASKISKGWFTDSVNLSTLGKDAYEKIAGAWIVELPELSGMRRADQEAVKAFITSTSDKYRPAYGKMTVEQPRQCILIGSTNEIEFLQSTTGNRRYWPVVVEPDLATKSVFNDLPHEIDLIWSEAMHYYKAGEELYLTGEIANEAKRLQGAHYNLDDRAGIIEAYLNTPVCSSWAEMDINERKAYVTAYYNDDNLTERGDIERTHVCVAEIWCEALGNSKESISRANTKQIHEMMRYIPGWRYRGDNKKEFPIYGLQRHYVRVLPLSNDKPEISEVVIG